MRIRKGNAMRKIIRWMVETGRRVWVLWHPPVTATPLSTILQDHEASTKLHEFLLGSFDETKRDVVKLGAASYLVRVINLNPAPPIPRDRDPLKTPTKK